MSRIPRTSLLAVLLVVAVAAPPAPAAAPGRLDGVCFSPFHDNESPHAGVFPLPSELEQDVALAGRVAKAVRTYSVANTGYLVPEMCQRRGLDCYPGAWLGRSAPANEMEVELLTRVGNAGLSHVKGLFVGNEVLLRHDLSEAQLVRYLRHVRQAVKLPVTTGEQWPVRLKHPALAAEVDFLTVHVYPYWDEVPVERAAAYTLERLDRVRKQFPGKRLVLGEFGWPSAGGKHGAAVASPENQARYLRDVLPLLDEKGVAYFYFDLCDEKWKTQDEGEVGAHWGLFRADGRPKPDVKPLLPAAAAEGTRRPPRSLGFPK